MWDPDAQAPRFNAVLERALPDPDVRAFLQRWAGSALTGIAVQALLLFVGAGANSKSVIVGALQAAIGDGYATVAHKSLLVADRHEGHPTHLASLRGARLVVAPETQAGDRLNEELVKNLTGGDRLRARRMREDEWSFAPSWSAAMHTNHQPRIRGTDEGIWRRLHQIPFDVTIPPDERDEALLETIVADELPGVLNWMVAGCLDWQTHNRRLTPPTAVTAATEDYRREQDHVGRFLDACCLIGDSQYRVYGKDLRDAYEAWCESEGERPWTGKALGVELRRRGCEPVKIGGSSARGWKGLAIRVVSDVREASAQNLPREKTPSVETVETQHFPEIDPY
jgi:putative DNA primase/helicase